MSTSRSGAREAAYHHGDLRSALVAAGLAILEEGGDPAALSLREAARRAGVSAMAPYRHFEDKDALLVAVATAGFERFGAALTEADAHPDKTVAIVEQGVAYVRFALENPALFRLMFGHSGPTRPQKLHDASKAAFSVLETRVASLVAPEMAPSWAAHCWALAHGIAALCVDRCFETGGDPIAMARHLLSLSAIPPVRARFENAQSSA